MNKFRLLVAILLFANCGLLLAATPDPGIENGLIDALRFNKSSSTRVANSGKAIRAYKRAKIVNHRPEQRADYIDYYVVKKPSKFMGHDLMVIEEEYITRYTGCCVNPGIGVTVRAIGDTENLAKFAKENSCSFSGDINLQAQFDDVAIKFKVPRGRYASLSCRDNDASR